MEDKFSFFELSTAFSLVAFLTLAILRRLRFNYIVMIIFCAALGCSFIQFATTSPWDFSNDPYGHLDYIHTLATTWTLPPPLGFQTQQPPLYYAIAATFRNIGSWLGLSTLYSARLASVFLYYGGAIFSALLLRRFVTLKPLFYVGLLTVLFWPAAAHTSVKVTNDVCFFFFASGFIYFLTRWLDETKPRFLAFTIAFTAGGIATKGSAVLLLIMLGITLLWQLARKKIRFRIFFKRWVLIALLLLVCGMSINFGRTLYWRIQHDTDVEWLINRFDDYANTSDYTDNRPPNYLRFDYSAFIDHPFLRESNAAPESLLVANVLL